MRKVSRNFGWLGLAGALLAAFGGMGLGACSDPVVPIGGDPLGGKPTASGGTRDQAGLGGRMTGGIGGLSSAAGGRPPTGTGGRTGGASPAEGGSPPTGIGGMTGGATPAEGGSPTTGVGGTTGDGGSGGTGQVSPFWSADSIRLEIGCLRLTSEPCAGSWAADTALLTPEQVGILAQMTPTPPSEPRAFCDVAGYLFAVTDRFGTTNRAWGTPFSVFGVMSCVGVNYAQVNPTLVQAFLATITWCGSALVPQLGSVFSSLQPGQCSHAFSPSAGSSLWTRFTLPIGTSYVATAMNGNRPGAINQNVALRLYDSTGTTLLAEAQPGASLTVTEPGDYALEVRNVTGVGCQVALQLEIAQ